MTFVAERLPTFSAAARRLRQARGPAAKVAELLAGLLSSPFLVNGFHRVLWVHHDVALFVPFLALWLAAVVMWRRGRRWAAVGLFLGTTIWLPALLWIVANAPALDD